MEQYTKLLEAFMSACAAPPARRLMWSAIGAIWLFGIAAVLKGAAALIGVL